MSAGQDYALERACPTCRTTLRAGLSACPTCGGIPEVERARLAASAFIDRGFGLFRGRLRGRAINRGILLWLLALTPILIGPPVIALILVGVIVGRERHGLSPGQTLNLAAVVVASLANLGLSAWADVHLAGDAVRYALTLKRAFQDWVSDLLTIRVVPGGMPHGGGGGGGRSA